MDAKENKLSAEIQRLNKTVTGKYTDDKTPFFTKDVEFASDRGISYRILAGSSSYMGAGGQGQVYRALRLSDNKSFVIKVYNPRAFDDELYAYDRKKVCEFLSANTDFRKTHIMPLIDYGQFQPPVPVSFGGDTFADEYLHFDINPVCKPLLDGGRNAFNYNELRTKVVPPILRALKTLHSANIVHRDIKAQNLFLLDGEMVLGDFGISSIVTPGKGVETRSMRATPTQIAPEVMMGLAVTPVDYYSLGYTIAVLYNGRDIYNFSKTGDNNDAGKESLRVLRSILVNNTIKLNNCPSSEQDLQLLVDSLIVFNHEQRAGCEDVRLWLDDKSGFVRKWQPVIDKNRNPVPASAGAPAVSDASRAPKTTWIHRTSKSAGETDAAEGFEFEGQRYSSNPELVKAMIDKWEAAKKYLYPSSISAYTEDSSIIAKHLKKHGYNTVFRHTVDILQQTKPDYLRDIGMGLFLHMLLKTGGNRGGSTVYWQGTKLQGTMGITPIAMFRALTDTNQNWYNKNINEVLSNIRILAFFFGGYKSGSDEYTAIRLQENLRKTDIYNGSKSIDIKKVLHGTGPDNTNDSALTLIYKYFEGICAAQEDKAYIRKHYIEKGPKSYLWWIKNNIQMYSFNGSAGSLESRLKGFRYQGKELSSDMSIHDIDNAFFGLQQLHGEFVRLLQGNIFLASIGLAGGRDKNGITCASADAFLSENFFGIPVPAGYARHMEEGGFGVMR